MNKQKTAGMHSKLAIKEKVIGLKQVLKHAKADDLSIIYIATDVDKEVSDKLYSVAKTKNIPVKLALSKRKLGQACDIDVSAACVGILTKV